MSRLIAAPHPFKTEVVDRVVPDGLTLAQMLEVAQCDPVLAAHAHIWIGEHRIPRDRWHLVRPKAGATITIRVVPQGGKSPLRTVLTIAVLVGAAAVSGGALAGLGGAGMFAAGSTSAALAGAAVGIAGNLLISAIAPVRPPSLPALSGTGTTRESPTLFIEGARNQARPFGTVPVVLGTHRMVPPLGVQTYTETIGDDNYLRMMVVWGYGPLKIEDIKIGETPIADFDGVQIETREGRASDDPLTLIPDTVSQDDFSILLTQASDWQSRAAQPNADELSVDITFPQGLAQFNAQGKRNSRTVAMQIQFREVGAGSWSTPTFTAKTVPDAWVSGDTVQFSQNRTSAVRHGFRWSVPSRGDYEVRIRRTTSDATSGQIFDQFVWTALRAITDEDPIQFEHPVAVTALVIKATDQLNRAVDELNATVSSYVDSFFDETYDLTGGTLPAGTSYTQPTADFDGSWIDDTGTIEYAPGPDTLRWEHRWNGSAWALAGLLVEPEETNSALWAEEFDDAVWTQQSCTITPDQTLAPDGSLTADLLTRDGVGSRLCQAVGSLPLDQVLSAALFIEAAPGLGEEGMSIRISRGTNSAGYVQASFTFSDGQLTTQEGSTAQLLDGGVIRLADDKYRIWVVGTPEIQGNPGTTNVIALTRTAVVNNGAYIWGATVNQADYVGSYIPAEGTAQTRAAGVFTITETPQGDPLPNGTYDVTISRYGEADELLTGEVVSGNSYTVPTSTAPLRSVRLVGTPERVSANPADLYRHVLQGVANARALPDARVDIDRLEEWHAFNETHGFEFNMVRDFQAGVWDTLADIAAVGRGSPAQIDGKWSVVYDYEQTVPVQHFTPRNSWGFEAEKAFPVQPDALRIRFSNRDEDWRQDERIVYADGFTALNAEKFDGLDAPGITDPEHIWKFGRFALAQMKLRPERWIFNVDFEYLVARRGDLVLVTHDVLLVGLASGRIKAVHTGGSPEAVTGITVDETLTMSAGTDYGVSIRTVDDVKSTHQIVTDAGGQTTVTFTTPIALANAPSVGDLFGFGPLGSETIEGLLLSIEPSTELSARVICLPASNAVYSSDTGIIPEFDSKLTPQASVPAAVITNVRSDESVLQLGSGNTLVPHIAVSVEQADAPILDVQIRASGTDEPFYDASVVQVSGDDYLIGGVEQGASYDLRVRWRDPDRLPAGWTPFFNHRVVGQTNPPGALVNATISVFGGNALIRWDRPGELDVRFGGEVRFRHTPDTDPDSAAWQSSTSIGTAAKGDALFAALPLKPGVYLARVYDKGGRPSDPVALATKQASVLLFANVDTVTESPSFTGAKVNTVADAGTLKLAGTGLFDDIADLDSVDDLDSFGGIASTGTYTFAGGFDLGTVTRCRLTSMIDATSVNVLDRIDDRTDDIDSWQDFDGTVQSAANARVQVRHTDGDPAGSPVAWSVWNDLDSAEFEARGFQFRVLLTTEDPAFNIRVDALSVVCEEI
jgi:hypothetical protein